MPIVAQAPLLMLVLLATAGAQERSDALPDLAAVPSPLLQDFEPNVRSQLAQARAAVAEAVGGGRRTEARQAFSRLCLVYLRYELMGAATPCLAQLRRLEPDDSRWPYYQSILFEREGRFGRALEGAERSLSLGRDDLATRLRAANLHYLRGEEEASEAGYRRALEIEPGSSAALFGLGRLAADRGDARTAADLFRRALAGQPPGSVIHHHLGMAYRELGDLAAAREELSRNQRRPVVFPDPLYDQLNRLGVSREEIFEAGLSAARADRPEVAVRTFQKVLEIAPDDADAHFNLARSLIELEDFAAAEQHLRQALALQAYPAAHFNLSILYGRTGRLEQAAAELDRAVAADPQNLDWRVMQARSIAQRGDIESAIGKLEEIAALDPGLPDAHRALGAMHAAEGRAAAAADSYRRLLVLVPGDEEGQTGLALSLLRQQDFGAAHRILEGALATRPQSLALRHLMARLLATSPDPALRDGARAVVLAEAVVAAQLTVEHAETLAMALAEAGRFDEAATWQQRVVDEIRRSGRTASSETGDRLRLYLAGRPFHGPWSL